MDKFHLLTGLGLLAVVCTAQAAQEREHPMAGLDQDGDGSVNFQEFMESDSPFLTEIDSDGNGVLTLDEFLNNRSGFGRRGNADRQSQDEDGDSDRQARMGQMAEQQFAQMDLDGDETVTAAEFKEASFLRMDRDSDGQITAREMRPSRVPGGRGPGRRGGNGPRGQNQ